MANEKNKDFNRILLDSKDMSKVKILEDEKIIRKYRVENNF